MNDERSQALEIARSLGTLEGRNALADAVEQITKLGGFAPRDASVPTARYESFDPDQREMLRHIAEKEVGRGGSISGWTGAGVPKDTPSLRRWVGVAPPGVLEHPVGPPGDVVPRWYLLQALALDGVTWSQAAERVLEGVGLSERLDVLLGVLSNAYGLLWRFESSLSAAHLERALTDAEHEGATWAQQRLEAIAAADLDPVWCGVLTPKLLSPMLRAAHGVGFVVPSCFDESIEWTPSNRTILASLPEERRSLMARKTVSRWGAPVFAQRLATLEELSDLLVTPEVVKQLEATAKQWPALKGTLPRIAALKSKR